MWEPTRISAAAPTATQHQEACQTAWPALRATGIAAKRCDVLRRSLRGLQMASHDGSLPAPPSTAESGRSSRKRTPSHKYADSTFDTSTTGPTALPDLPAHSQPSRSRPRSSSSSSSSAPSKRARKASRDFQVPTHRQRARSTSSASLDDRGARSGGEGQAKAGRAHGAPADFAVLAAHARSGAASRPRS